MKVKSGFRSGRLVVVEIHEKRRTQSGGYLNFWKCLCDCGQVAVVTNRNLTSGHTQSCGCLSREINSKVHFMHGFARKGAVHKFHMVWRNILARCGFKNNSSFERYGGRGITVCERWKKFENFRDDMFSGWKDGLTVERINNDGPYAPENCRWATRKEQTLNTRRTKFLTFSGQTMPMCVWAEKYGIHQVLLRKRIVDLGWTLEKAITTPVRKIKHENLSRTEITP